MTDTLLKYCEKLPIELVRYILDFKKKHNCIICKKILSIIFTLNI